MSENPRDLPDVVAAPPLLYAVPLGLALIAQHYFPRRLLPASLALVLGVLLGGLSLVGFLGVVAFRRAATSPNPYRPSNALVVGGPFRLTRNPMYVGFTLMYLAVACLVNTVWPVVALPLILIVMQRGVILREEAYLERRFGADYRDYKARVRRWI